MSKLSGLCPNCGSKLIYEDNEQTVMCYACDSLINVADFASNKSTVSASVGGTVSVAPMMMGSTIPIRVWYSSKTSSIRTLGESIRRT